MTGFYHARVVFLNRGNIDLAGHGNNIPIEIGTLVIQRPMSLPLWLWKRLYGL